MTHDRIPLGDQIFDQAAAHAHQIRGGQPRLTFLEATALDERNQADARAACAEQERDEARDDRDGARADRDQQRTRAEKAERERDSLARRLGVRWQELTTANAEIARLDRIRADLQRENDGLRNDHRSLARANAGYANANAALTAANARLRQQLAAQAEQLDDIREARAHTCDTPCTEGGCDFDLGGFVDRVDGILGDPETITGEPLTGPVTDESVDVLAQALERAASVRIDSQGVIWKPTDSGWHHEAYGTLTLDEIHDVGGQTRAALLIEIDDEQDAGTPDISEARVLAALEALGWDDDRTNPEHPRALYSTAEDAIRAADAAAPVPVARAQGKPDRVAQASRWIDASGIPVVDREVRAWLDQLGIPVPVGIWPLLAAVRQGVIAAGDAGYEAGRREQAEQLDRYAEALDLIAAAVCGGTDDIDNLRDGVRSMVQRVRPEAVELWAPVEARRRARAQDLPALVFNAISRALQDVWPISVPLPVVRERCTAAVLEALDGGAGQTAQEIRPAGWEQQAIDAATAALRDEWTLLTTDPVAARRLATAAVQALIDGWLVGAGGRCRQCGQAFPRTLPAGQDPLCWTCETGEQAEG